MVLPAPKKIFASCLLAAGLLYAQAACALGLIEAYNAALVNDPAYQVARHENEAGQQNRAIGLSNLLPTVGISYSASKVKGDRELTNINVQEDLDYTSKVGVLSARQPLFNLDAYARYRQGAAQADSSEAAFSSRSQELIVRVTTAFIEVRYAEDQLALATAQRDAFVEQMRVNRRLFELGEGTKTDMLETYSKAELAEAQVIEAKDELVTARNVLSGIVGVDVGSLDRLSPNFQIQAMKPQSVEVWRTLALEKNPEIESLRLRVEVANQEVNKNRAGHFPKLDMVASYSDNQSESPATSSQDTKARSVGIQLNVPIFTGGYVNATTTQAIANRERARSELQVRTTQILVELNKQYSLVLSSAARIAALTKAVESAQLLITATQKSIEGGVRINLDLLNAQQQFFASKRDLAQAKYNHLLGYLRLRYAAGALTHEDLKTIAAYFVRN